MSDDHRPDADDTPAPAADGLSAELRALAATLPSVVWRYSRDGVVTFCSDKWEDVTGWPAETALGDGWERAIHPDDLGWMHEAWQEMAAVGGDWLAEYRAVRPDGSVRWLMDMGTPVTDAAGEILYYVGTTLDITERVMAEQRTARRAAQQSSVADLGARAIDLDTGLDELVATATEMAMTGLELADAWVAELGPGSGLALRPVPVRAREGSPTAPMQAALHLAAASIERRAAVASDAARRAGDPTVDAVTAIAAPILLRGGAFGAIVGTRAEPQPFSDEDRLFLTAVANIIAGAIERERARQALVHRAMHDSLTGLPNRALLLDRVETAIGRSSRSGASVALLFIDLDHFKDINDTAGHAAGDRLLTDVAARLQHCIRPGDTLARLGGDEFVVLCEQLADADEVVSIAERIIAALADPFEVVGEDRFVTASIGVAVNGTGTVDAALLIRDADVAMYAAKGGGRNRLELFDEAMRERRIARVRTEQLLHRAVERDELELHYQPIVSLADGALEGFEALLRWRRADGGLEPPAAFVPIAEETGMIIEIGRWVVDAACRAAAELAALAPGEPPLGMTINVSARQLDDDGLATLISRAVEAHGLAGGQLGVEITESALLEDEATASRLLSALHDRGVRVLLDDFGTGYSSLGYLRRFPFDTIKLDRAFIRGVDASAAGLAIVRAVTDMAIALDLNVIVEGVETAGEATALGGLGALWAQGYHFARPLDLAAARAFAANGARRRASA